MVLQIVPSRTFASQHDPDVTEFARVGAERLQQGFVIVSHAIIRLREQVQNWRVWVELAVIIEAWDRIERIDDYSVPGLRGGENYIRSAAPVLAWLTISDEDGGRSEEHTS